MTTRASQRFPQLEQTLSVRGEEAGGCRYTIQIFFGLEATDERSSTVIKYSLVGYFYAQSQ